MLWCKENVVIMGFSKVLDNSVFCGVLLGVCVWEEFNLWIGFIVFKGFLRGG